MTKTAFVGEEATGAGDLPAFADSVADAEQPEPSDQTEHIADEEPSGR
ncbi:MAG: hypothetical protein L0H41_09840 [Microlunatus sp.]|nr:hypothetical protein [Microlunatus sp.]